MLFQTSVAFLQRNTDNYNMKALCRSEKDRPTLADKLTGGRLQMASDGAGSINRNLTRAGSSPCAPRRTVHTQFWDTGRWSKT